MPGGAGRTPSQQQPPAGPRHLTRPRQSPRTPQPHSSSSPERQAGRLPGHFSAGSTRLCLPRPKQQPEPALGGTHRRQRRSLRAGRAPKPRPQLSPARLHAPCQAPPLGPAPSAKPRPPRQAHPQSRRPPAAATTTPRRGDPRRRPRLRGRSSPYRARRRSRRRRRRRCSGAWRPARSSRPTSRAALPERSTPPPASSPSNARAHWSSASANQEGRGGAERRCAHARWLRGGSNRKMVAGSGRHDRKAVLRPERPAPGCGARIAAGRGASGLHGSG